MSNITRVGVDLAKNLIQVHAVDLAGKVIGQDVGPKMLMTVN